jgi:hypothetical protein
MYNIHSHYENIFHYLNTIITDPRLIYLYPYGSTNPENIEIIRNDIGEWHRERGPLFIFYDQEPILGEFNFKLFDHIYQNYMGPKILVTTEKNSNTLELVKQKYGWNDVYYFHHIFAAHDWFRGYQFDPRLTEPTKRKLVKKYITFNRLTSSKRVYRSLFISELIQRNILDQGYVSYNDICPENNQDYVQNLSDACKDGLIDAKTADSAINNIKQANLPLRIDYKDQTIIPNHSFVLSAVPETQESFVYVVTETCYWEQKCHLTEKIFKPILSKMPFILVGPAHNLAYLRSYGFKTFDKWINESYDTIEDPIARMNMIGAVLSDLCALSLHDLECMLAEMQEVLDYNYNLFYSNDFIQSAWAELTTNLKTVGDATPTSALLRLYISQLKEKALGGRIGLEGQTHG